MHRWKDGIVQLMSSWVFNQNDQETVEKVRTSAIHCMKTRGKEREKTRTGYFSLGCLGDRIECGLRQVDGISVVASRACISDGDGDTFAVLRVGDMDLFPAERRCVAGVSVKSRV